MFADVVKKLQSVQSFSMDILLERPDKPATRDKPDRRERRYHIDQDGRRYCKTNSAGRITIVNNGTALSLDAETKEARFQARRPDDKHPIDELLAILKGWKVNQAEDLGEKVVDGQNTKGFRTFVDTPGEREYTVEVWYDSETSFPVQIDMQYKNHKVHMTYSKFRWNPKLDESLFELTVPPGYAVVHNKEGMPVQVGSEADIKDPLIKKLIRLGGRFHWNDKGGFFNRPTAGVEPTLENVRKVYFTNSKMTEADLAHLKAMPNLTSLDLEDTPITDASLIHLRTLTGLRYLHLDRTKVTDAGLKHLAVLTKLRQLDIRGTKVTQQGAETLKQALPRLHTVRR